ncbi:MAG TPA: hypothetical protein VLH15_05700 [Dehalococcoidales bacterium]|nr:hypothetical protein [Dehalococcoidales bacterium]
MTEKKAGKTSRKKTGQPVKEETSPARQNDLRIIWEGWAIFSETELRELINTVYAGYRYRGAQLEKMSRLISFLASEENRFSLPEMIEHSRRLSDFMETFRDFLNRNFYSGEPAEDGEAVYQFQPEGTSYETEAFLGEFQLISLDIEKAYRNYRQTASNSFNIQLG